MRKNVHGHIMHRTPLEVDSGTTAERPWWVTRWVPDFLFKVPYIGARIDILARIRDRSSGEKITALKIYFGHVATALAFGVVMMGTGNFILAAAAGVLWFLVAEIFDIITFGASLDNLFDGLEYGMGFLPFIVAGLVTPHTVEYATAIGPVGLSIFPSATFLAVFLVWFQLLPIRAESG